jgi:predicted nucleotidyltransferase
VQTGAGPTLLPILRSRPLADILTRLLLDPDQERTVSELADSAGTSVATALREVNRAGQAGLVVARKAGNTRYVRANPDSPLFEPMRELLLRSFGPAAVIAEEMAGIDGIEAIYLFGSWAARYQGEPGAAPADVDVLVIGRPNRDDLYAAAERAERRIARPVQVTIRSRSWWAHGDDAFRASIRQRPMVAVHELAEGAS